jgi:N-acetylglucosaminyldiphosphoundecaprenol N-acetyl-beta-D-mannosaminyltransferase
MRKLLVVLGIPVDNLTMEEALDRCDEFIKQGRATGKTHQIATVNADFVVNSLHDPELRRILQEADMTTADGMPLIWAARLLDGPMPGRVTGADMVPALATRSAQKGYSIFFLGAREGIAAKAAEILQQRNPGLQVAGVFSPPPSSVIEMDRSVMEMVQATKPDILLVAFGNPKQEKWIRMYAHELQVPIAIGVGGTFDMIVGVTKRAPRWMQRIGLEWLYRMAQEPRRLLKRYLLDFGYFGYYFARQWWAMRRGAAIQPIAGDPPPPPAAPADPGLDQPFEPIELPGASWSLAEPEQRTPVISIYGRLDIRNQAGFVAAATNQLDADPHLVLSLAQATFLDSSALGALVGLAKRARDAGGELWLSDVPDHLLNLLELVHLDRFFEIVTNPAAAEKHRNAEPIHSQSPAAAPGGWTIVKAPRMFDSGTASEFGQRCLQLIEQSARLVIDLNETVFLASAGMAALVKIQRVAGEHNGELRIAGGAPDVLRTLTLVKLDTILRLYPDVAAATEATAQSNHLEPLPPLPTT